MAGVTQTIDTYYAGISQQSDLKKFPGQVKDIINGIPDVTDGLYKRPGAKRIGTTPLANVQSNGSWFHYYRDETEGSYIGQVASDGKVRVWSCNDGAEKNVWYATDNAAYNASTAAHTSITGYLTPSSATSTEDIQALTINDTTFLNNRTKTVGTTGTTDARPESHFAYIDLLRTENGRQYSLNIYSTESTSTINKATRVKISSDTLAEGGNTGTCPGIGTQVFSVTAAGSYSGTNIVSVKNSSGTDITSGRDNLIFRITTLGQNGQLLPIDDTDSGTPSNVFSCTYNRQVVLLHGGEGWEVGDEITVTLDQAKTNYNYTVKIEEIEAVAIKANIKAVRPTPTPFDADTAVTVDTILGGISAELPGTISHVIIGNGIYLHSSNPFSVEISEKDLMRVMQEDVNDVAELPNQCKDGYIVKVANSKDSSDDDYYLKFKGNDNLDGPGSWVECAAPGIVKSLDATTMPHVLQRQADGDFLVKKYTWEDREVGDDNTNPLPTFADGSSKINNVLFFRNRLALLSGSNVILSRPGELTTPSFFGKTALAVSAVDPIDISSSSEFPSDLFDGIETTAGLLVFSTNQQFLLSSDAEILNPDTAKLRSVCTYNYNKDLSPISLGTTVGYLDNSGKFSRFNEMLGIQREQEPLVGEQSKIVPTLLPKDLDLLTNSRENQLVLFGKTNTDIVYGYKYLVSGNERPQQAWFKWKFNNPLKYHFIIDDNYYLLDTDNFLQKVSLMQTDVDPSIDETVGSDTSNYLIHLDNWITVSGGSYNNSTKLTTFTNQATWLPSVTTPNGKLVIVDIDPNSVRVGRYADCTLLNNNPNDDFTLPGDWSREVISITVTNGGSNYTSAPSVSITGGGGTGAEATASIANGAVTAITLTNNGYNFTSAPTVSISGGGGSSAAATAAIHDGSYYMGYLYEYHVHFPHFYLTQVQGKQAKADVNSSLIIHRIKLNFGKSGLYTTTLYRKDKADYSETYESSISDEYSVSDAPYLPEQVQTVPVYEKTDNVEVILKSSHPAPATLNALTWEGDYSQRNYKRV